MRRHAHAIQLYSPAKQAASSPLLTTARSIAGGPMFGADLQIIASAALVAGVAISKRVTTFVLKRKGHSCQKSEMTRNDRAFIA
jgi:hypothetical protein